MADEPQQLRDAKQEAPCGRLDSVPNVPLDQVAEEQTSYNHQCYICDKTFSANSNLNRHLRKIHKENVQSPYNNVKCALCDSFYPSSSIYNNHLESEHAVKIELERLTFASKQAFEDWKHSIENATTSQFIKSRGEKKTKDVNKTYYSCNRSGYYVSKARTRKALKKQGSRKINGRCPASMNVTINSDLTIDVRFVKTHVGHNFELKHLDLSEKDRDLIVQKLASGITKRDIIKQIRSNSDSQTNGAACKKDGSISPTLPSTSARFVVQPTSNQLHNNCLHHLPANHCATQIDIIPATNEIMVPTTSSSSTLTLSSPSPQNAATSCQRALGQSPPPNITQAINSLAACFDNGTNNSSSAAATDGQQTAISRLQLATTKDIHNILNSKHLDPKKICHNYDLNNLEAWIREMSDFNEPSSVLFYKKQGQLSDKFSKLTQDDFMLVLMKEGQAKVFRDYGDKCVIIDSTHKIHCEYLHVAYTAVVDDQKHAFPVAFMFSTRTNADILEAFFAILKEKVGTIQTRMLIADELHDFYQAWWKVMSMPTHNLLTPQSVFYSWSERFKRLNKKDKLRRMKKQLKMLLTESENDKFLRTHKQLIADFRTDPDTSPFMDYFMDNYSRNPDVWSACLRKNYGVANHHLWSLHERFKSVYKEGKGSRKMCKYIGSLMGLFEDYQLNKLASLEAEDLAEKQASLELRHKKSIETCSVVYEVSVKPVYWLCPSDSSNDVLYEVRPNRDDDDNKTELTKQSNEETLKDADRNQLELKRCCELSCQQCDSCRHEFKCTCLDYVVNLNMCKHIHRICSMCKWIKCNC